MAAATTLSAMFGAFADRRWVFVDVETTGASPARERITEVGVVTVETDGAAQRVTEWSSLVNPGVPIPAEIQWLTGISNEMVRDAPRFAELADALYDRLADAVFVAHNARFDYGFLKAEFARAGYDWRAATLCTVRLSRHLYPDRGPHSLDAIVARFGLDGEQRHRALGDARILWRLLRRWRERHGDAELDAAVGRLLSRPSLPPALPPGEIDALPHAPGVYGFYGANAHPIYIGKSVDLKARVLNHFAGDHASGTDLRLSQEVQRIEWEQTAGEIGALLREAELVKTRLPAHNVALRRKQQQVFVALDADARPRIKPVAAVPLDALGEQYGPFATRAGARRFLQELAAGHGLCLKTMRLEGRARRAAADAPCFNFQIHRCRGACIGAEAADLHAARLRELLAPQRVPPWPHAGAVALVERDPAGAREDLHVVDRWCWLGTVRTPEAAVQLGATAPREFDADVYRIVHKALRGDPALALLDLEGR
jgi:DNA polymerase-3 subunit epsilon